MLRITLLQGEDVADNLSRTADIAADPPCFPYNQIHWITSQAQDQTLVGCDAVHCPTNYKTSTCPVDNTTLSYLGITSLNTSLASSPLTWTLGTQVTYDPSNKSLVSLDRDYFLGTPPTVLNLTSNTYHGCALFFDGVSATNLSFPNTPHESGSGTCNDALSTSCVTDLLAQSQSELNTLLSSDSSNESKNWLTVKLTELTGSNAAPFSQKSSDCNATTGENYNLSLVQSTRTSAAVSSGTLQKLMFGITPVLTILYDPKNNASGESHLSCLKVVATSQGEVADTDPATKKSDSTLGKSVWGWGLGFVLGFWIAYTSL
ncbi:vacuolar sorting VPS1 dynamin protein [Rutstroemia sp. NJR-2017a WRK4]|nr:vacuolar sorting VPS1 dynamin protein [Rutstroemia sp. NJR-2017a WRK4]